MLAGLAVGFGLLATGCGGNTATSTSPTSAGAAPSGGTSVDGAGSGYKIVPAAEVKAGLTEVRAMAAGVKATLAAGGTYAEADVRKMYDRWFLFEGSVRQNDKNLYLQMEDGLAAIKAGVEQKRPDKVDRGLKDLEDGSSSYLVKFP